MKYTNTNKQFWFDKTIGKRIELFHFDLRTPRDSLTDLHDGFLIRILNGSVVDAGSVEISNKESVMVVRKYCYNNKHSTDSEKHWHIWVQISQRNIDKINKDYDLLSTGWMENGKMKVNVMCHKKYSDGFKGVVAAGNLGDPLGPPSNTVASEGNGGNL